MLEPLLQDEPGLAYNFTQPIARITSYNVCYTKLLRGADGPAALADGEALAMAVELGIGVSFVSLLAAMPRLALGRLVTVDVKDLELRRNNFV